MSYLHNIYSSYTSLNVAPVLQIHPELFLCQSAPPESTSPQPFCLELSLLALIPSFLPLTLPPSPTHTHTLLQLLAAFYIRAPDSPWVRLIS